MKVIDVKHLIDQIEEDFKFEGGSVDFMSEFRTRVAELQECHYSEDGQSTFSVTPMFAGSAAGFTVVPTIMGAMFGGGGINQDEILGPQTEAKFEKFREWLQDEGRLTE